MSFATNVTNLATRIATEFRTIRNIISGSATGDASGLNTTSKNLVGALNELAARPTGGGSLDGLSDVTVTNPVQGDILLRGATEFTNVPGTTYFQPRDSDLDAIAALSTTTYGQSLLTLASVGSLTASLSAATETTFGTTEYATTAETTTATADNRSITPLKLQQRLTAVTQPLDSDLTAIAALTTTTFGRALLTLADSAALTGQVLQGSTSVLGKLQLATNAETITGTDTAKATTAAGSKAAVDVRIVNDSTLASNSTTNAPSIASVKAYADNLIGANDAMVYKGAIDASASPSYPAGNRGDTWRISVAGKIGGSAGPNVEAGDLIICTTDGTASGTHATVGASWTIIQTNIDGAVTGPTSSTSGNLATFNGTSGKVVADSGVAIDNDGTLAANSASRVPTQSAVVTALAGKQGVDAELTALAGLVSAANKLPYFTGSGTASLADLTTFGRSLIDDADAATARATLGLGTAATQASTAFQSADATLTALAGLTTAADQIIYSTGADTFAMATATSFGRGMLGYADAAAARSGLSVYSQTEIGNPETDFVAQFVAALNA